LVLALVIYGYIISLSGATPKLQFSEAKVDDDEPVKIDLAQDENKSTKDVGKLDKNPKNITFI